MAFSGKWMELEIIVLRDVNLTQGNIKLSLIWNLNLNMCLCLWGGDIKIRQGTVRIKEEI